jgi:hypothetical protein
VAGDRVGSDTAEGVGRRQAGAVGRRQKAVGRSSRQKAESEYNFKFQIPDSRFKKQKAKNKKLKN